jgi:mono/diheme cytochrome c family protein
MTASSAKSKWGRILLVLVILVALGGWLTWWKLFRQVPQTLADDSMEEYFKYGSIGTEEQDGIPFWIWLVLPKMFPEYLPSPGGWASLGFAWEQGRELPVGFSKRTIGFERVGVNCALCHTGTLREDANGVPAIYLGAPATTADILGYQRFLFRSAADPRFNAANILGEIGQVYDMPLIDRLLYRFVLIPATKKALLKQAEQFAWTNQRPDWGPGRIDPFNPVKARVLKVDVGDTIGNSDMEPIWNLAPRAEGGMAFHWDGLNTNLTEVVLSSAIGDGTLPKALPLERLAQLEDWLKSLPPPRFEERFPVDATLAAAGSHIFQDQCARCHAMDGEKTGQVLTMDDPEWAEAGSDPADDRPPHTDAHRAQMWTPEAATAYNAYAAGYPWKFNNFRSTGGYVNVPLDGLWLRAPYLHNGSVPYLSDLLNPPSQRPKVFYRGLDLYDPVRGGFVAEGPDAVSYGWRYDTEVTGNSNQGHLWGTQLAPDEKKALIEYLKTL